MSVMPARAAGARVQIERPASLLLDVDTGDDLVVFNGEGHGADSHRPRADRAQNLTFQLCRGFGIAALLR